MQKAELKDRQTRIHSSRNIQSVDWQLCSATSGYPLFNDTPNQNTDYAHHLRILGISPKLAGYRCLVCAIRLYAANKNLMLKQIYPEVARICDLPSAYCVERNIRSALRKAWNDRPPEVWKRYFPVNQECPSNKEFIASIAEVF